MSSISQTIVISRGICRFPEIIPAVQFNSLLRPLLILHICFIVPCSCCMSTTLLVVLIFGIFGKMNFILKWSITWHLNEVSGAISATSEQYKFPQSTRMPLSLRDPKCWISLLFLLFLSLDSLFLFPAFLFLYASLLSLHNSHDSSLQSWGVCPMCDTVSFVPAMWSSVVRVIKDFSLAVPWWLLWSLDFQSSRQAFNSNSNIRYLSQIEAKDSSLVLWRVQRSK